MDLEILKIIMGAPATFVALAGAIGLIVKYLYKRFVSKTSRENDSETLRRIEERVNGIDALEQRMAKMEKSNQCQLRSAITRIYYQYINRDTIPFYEHENLRYLFDEYLTLGGNSYIPQIVPDILSKPIENSANAEGDSQ